MGACYNYLGTKAHCLAPVFLTLSTARQKSSSQLQASHYWKSSLIFYSLSNIYIQLYILNTSISLASSTIQTMITDNCKWRLPVPLSCPCRPWSAPLSTVQPKWLLEENFNHIILLETTMSPSDLKLKLKLLKSF